MQRNEALGPIHAPILAGVERLWAHKRLLGRDPVFWFDGTGLDDDAKTWTCRQTGTVLSEAGAGASPDLAAYGPHLGERVADFDGGKSLQSPNGIFGDIATEHFIFELALEITSSGSQRQIFDKRVGTTVVTILLAATNTLQAYIRDGVDGATIDAGAVSLGRVLAHLFVHRSGFGQWYVNAVASGAAVDVTAVDSLTNAGQITIGAQEGGAAPHDSAVDCCALWKGDDLLDTHLQPDLAKERASLWLGHSLLHNHGPKTPDTL